MLRCYVVHAVIPLVLFCHYSFERLHRQCLFALHTRTYIHTVAATEAVECVYYLNELHTGELLADSVQCFAFCKWCACQFVGSHQERTNSCVRTYISTLVTLNTSSCIPFGNKCRNATTFVLSCALWHDTIFKTYKCRYRKKVTILCIDRTCYVVYIFRSIVGCLWFYFQVRPCGIYSECLIFTTTIYCCIVLVNHIFTLLAVRLNDELLHLFDSQFFRNYACDTEECRLKDSVSAVAKTYFLSYLGSVDIIYCDIVVGEIFLHLVWQVLSQFFAFPDSVKQEAATLLQTSCHIIHIKICLNVACYEVRSIYQVS